MKIAPRILTLDETAAFGRELDAIRARVIADLGQRDVDHIRRMIKLVHVTEIAGRALLHFGFGPLTFVVGTTALGASKILENMEVGHNVMHGQYDWTRDPELDGRTYEWDTSCTGDDWRRTHNYEHHTFTNVLGKDHDIGYRLLRVTAAQPWKPHHLVQPVAAAILALLFQYGVGMHGATPKAFVKKLARQTAKDYVAFPLLALANAPRVFAGNLMANVMRNLWSFAIIFCGHFPDGVQVFEPDATATESRGAWYLRQLNGSANIEGGRTFHVLSGHLSHQIEHHLFPDLPASRYPEIAVEVREICTRYGQLYNTGSFAAQLGSVAKVIARYSLPATIM